MSQIQITNEISIRLKSLQAAITANANFNKAQQVTFEGSTFPALIGYSKAIQRVGNLGDVYKASFERDIAACEQIIENRRAMDRQAGAAIKAAIT